MPCRNIADLNVNTTTVVQKKKNNNIKYLMRNRTIKATIKS